jgi:hypothetical protein
LADHSDAPDPRTDITDLFIFQKPGGDAASVLILNIHPEASALVAAFDPSASYELKIDTDGDLEADIAIHILFAASSLGGHTATVYRPTGSAAQGTGRVGEVIVADAPVSVDSEVQITTVHPYRFFAGLRSDPWFADVDGVLNDFRFTGRDTFADRNVFGIVLEIPNTSLGTVAPIRIWARTMAPVHGQIDQVGRPLVNALFNRTTEDQAAFNQTPPTHQLARFGDQFAAVLESFGHTDGKARGLAEGLLPDVLIYDCSNPAGYPNGRRLTDDILDLRIAMMTAGSLTTDLVGPHNDLLDEFPYLGAPHPDRKSQPERPEA